MIQLLDDGNYKVLSVIRILEDVICYEKEKDEDKGNGEKDKAWVAVSNGVVTRGFIGKVTFEKKL